jgi:TrmH family RNA methyltransferase
VTSSPLVRRFSDARRDPELAVLEGFHAVKHALRFGAEMLETVATDVDEVQRLADGLAEDLATVLPGMVVQIPPEVLAALAPRAPRTGVMAIARRPQIDVRTMLSDPREAPIVLLEDPRNMTNVGASIRVAAAADAAGVLTTGDNDPWSPDALRGAAGLHFAQPVARIDELPSTERPLVAVDPGGDPLRPSALPSRAILAFGTERYGLSDELLARADVRVRIPMKPGVSSLNLATSVAAVLYGCPTS